jgi:hypothetical protein
MDRDSGARGAAPATRRDWVRAAIWVGAIVIAIIAAWIAVFSMMACGCGTVAA